MNKEASDGKWTIKLVESVQEPPNGQSSSEWQMDKEASKCKMTRKFQVQVPEQER